MNLPKSITVAVLFTLRKARSILLSKTLAKSIEINPDDTEAYNNRGLAYAKKGEIDTAIKDFSKVIEINPDDTEAYNNRGLAYAKKGEIDTAIKDFSKAIEMNPDDAEAYNRSRFYLRCERRDSILLSKILAKLLK